MLDKMWGKGDAPSLLVVVQVCTAALDIFVAISQKKIRKQSTSRPSRTALGYVPKNVQLYHKNLCSTMFIAALFVIVRNWKQPRMLLNQRKDRENIIHLHNGVLLSDKKMIS